MTGMDEHLEVERTYDVPVGFDLPDLTGLDAVATVDEPVAWPLEAVYVDTGDLRLLAAHTTLRRRTGGHDDGWHLKLPTANGDRLEASQPAGRAGSTPPVALRRLVTPFAAGAPLAPVATLRTDRTAWVLRDADGHEVAEVSLDAVSATVASAEATHDWTELEVELGAAGSRSLLTAIEDRLLTAGASVASSQSKLRRALSDPPATPAPDPRTAGGAALTSIAGLVDTLAEWEVALRRDQPRAVHQTRVTIRRLRSMLVLTRRLLDPAATESVRTALGQYAAVLGSVRDDEVLRGTVSTLFGQVDDARALSSRRRILAALDREEREHRVLMRKALDAPSHMDLWAALRELVAEPPLTPAGARPPAKELRKAIRKAWRRLDAQRQTMAELPPGAKRDEAVHEVRKSAKRLRYAVEGTAPVLGSGSAKVARRMKRFQELAGSLRDDQLGMHRLTALADAMPGDAFALGHLHGLLSARVASRANALDTEAARLAPQQGG